MGNKSGKHVRDQTCVAGPSPSIENLSFFYKDLSRTQAEDILKRHCKYPGTYLLRFSSQQRKYALTVIAAKNRIGHILISCPVEGCFYAENELHFESMESLINHYKSHSLPNANDYPVDVKLKNPVHRFRQQYPFPFQTDAVHYQLVTDKIYSSIRDPERDRQRENDRNEIYFYDDKTRITMLTPPSPPTITGPISTEYLSQNRLQAIASPKSTENDGYVAPATLPNYATHRQTNLLSERSLAQSRDSYLTYPKSIVNDAAHFCGSGVNNKYLAMNAVNGFDCGQKIPGSTKDDPPFLAESGIYSSHNLKSDVAQYCDVFR